MAANKSISFISVVIIFQISYFCQTTALFVSVQVDNEGVFATSNGKSASGPAWSTFKNDMNATGWAYLEVYTNEKFNDSEQAYAAGMAEGKATREMIVLHWHNTMESYCKQPYSKFCKRLHDYLTENLAWTYSQIRQHAGKDAYWHQVELFLTQMNGMSDGFYGISGKPSYIVKDVFGIMMLNQISGDLEDLESALQNQEESHVLGSGSCSGLIKVLANNSDLYVSQDTWNGYQSMLRILKKYSFKFHNTRDPASGVIAGQEMTFSSYPASLTSGDDFYTISSGLSTLETTIGNGNPKLWAYVTPKNSVVEGIRSMVANRLAKSGKQWSTLFSKFNSGTYNNMWMAVDYKVFTPGKPLADGLLYVLEQLPGKIVFKDLTSKLREQGYWASYNTPYFPEIFNMSGQNEMVKKYGDWFTFEHTPRANIFRRDHRKVTDISSMTKLMRYNDYQHDPLSRCNCTPPYSAENAISARCDLNPANGTYPFGALGHRSHGGTDMKLTTSSLFASLQFVAVAGPTANQQPPFQWSKTDFAKTVAHIGHPDLFKFSPITHKWGSR